MAPRAEPQWEIRYASFDGHEPVRDWLEELEKRDPTKQLAALVAIDRVLGLHGINVCETEWGKNLGKGLYELRILRPASVITRMFPKPDDLENDDSGSEGRVLLRILFTTHGRQIILLLNGYDKGKHPSAKRQQDEIDHARGLLSRIRHDSQ